MICVDTTFLVDLWRTKDRADSAARGVLAEHRGDEFAVPVHAAGEFLEGGAAVSAERLGQSLEFLRSFSVKTAGIETAQHYARIVAHLRAAAALDGRSKPDMWIAAWAVEHASPLVTRNTRHFDGIPGLGVIGY